jgi:hypothetical protein
LVLVAVDVAGEDETDSAPRVELAPGAHAVDTKTSTAA